MKRLHDCLNKTVGKLISKEDADRLVLDARALVAGGFTPIVAERQAVQNALDEAINSGRNILNQIHRQRPAAYKQASDFWEKETIRKAGMVPPPLPRFVTEAGMPAAAPVVPADSIAAAHNEHGGSTVNAVHGDLVGTNSYALSIFPDLTAPIPGKTVTAAQINEFAAKAQAAGVSITSPNISIGTWYDAESNTTFLDVSFTITNRETAIAFGQQFNQKAIFDLNALEEIPTGGTGTAIADLPSVAERLSILGREGIAQTTAAAPPGAPVETAGGVPAGAQGVRPEVGGVQEEGVAPPAVPAGPISDAAQEVVNSLPQEQRGAAQKAFARDDRNPLADHQREKGLPVSKRKDRPIAPEKNTKLVQALSKYDLGKSVAESLQAFASDPKLPRWVRLIADLLSQLGLGENVSIRAVNTPEASWRALYVKNKETGKGEILINMTHKGTGDLDLARRILHELVHHGTLTKLTGDETDLTAAEFAAKRELEKIFDYVKSNKEALGPEATRYGAATALQEFVSEIFANEKLRAKLNSIRPDGKVSLLQRFTDAVLKLLIGDRAAIMRPGSMLENAIRQAINVAGSPGVETSPQTIAAMHEQKARAARDANKHPNFQEQIAETVAPMADNMGISDNDLIERKLDHEAAFYAEDERKVVEAAVDERAGEINATPAEIAEVKKRIEDEVKYYRAYHPANAGWANKAIKVLGLEDKKGLTRGDPTKQNPSGIAFKIKYKDTPYTYARDDAGKPIQRFLKQGKPDKETGKPIDNPEWGKRVGQLASKMFDNLQEIMTRRGKGDDKARVAQVIVDQIEWYRSMRTRLRTEFGSMSDYVADVIAGFSPITDVPGNWNNFIDYFRHVMKGDYDEAFRKFDEYISADPENRSSGTYKKQFPPDKFPQLWPRKLLKEGQPLFGANTGNALMAGLDMWRAIKGGTAPKARNFGLNLIGQSLKATIDRWAGRYLQRMHAPTWRIPPSIEGAVTGGHMPGENVEFVSGDFGMGQDVFEQVAARLREGGHEIFKDVTAADLQAILWFGEKEVWEMRKWTDIMGAGSSMNVVAQATAAQRYEAGTIPGKTSAKDEKLMAETIELRTNLNAEAHMLGAKMVPSVNIADGKESKTFDGEWITEPEYNPENSVGHVARIAARLGKKAAHISRVIVNPYEVNSEMTPGLHIFFKGRVGDAEVKGVLDKLKAAGITDGISLTVDPRVRPEIIKSLDPVAGANQYNGVRVQYIPEYQAAGKTVPVEQDRAYMAAVKRGDMDAAQGMVTQAARVAGYNIGPVYHGTTAEDFLLGEFQTGWFTEDRGEAEKDYASGKFNKKAGMPRVISAFLRITNPSVGSGGNVEFLQEQGFDGMEVPPSRTHAAVHYIPFSPVDQVKSADLVIRDNKGNIIPLSQRFGTAGGMTSDKLKDAFAKAMISLRDDASIAESRVLYYDTLVLKKGVDYDSSGKLTGSFSEGRKAEWVGRARSEGSAAAARRDNVQKAIADRKRQDLELESRMEREEQERIAAYAKFQRRVQPKDRANDGGVDPPVVAAMQYEDETEPVRDPHGGRASLVRSMVERIRNASRDREGIEVPQSSQEVRGAAGIGGGAAAGRKGSAPLWRPLGATFRKREASLYQRVESAAALIRAANPEDSENPKDPARYENSQKLFDYLSGKAEPDDLGLKNEIAELRKEIPTVPAKAFESHGHLDSGSEADAFHDTDSGVVYKTFSVKDGKLGGYVPGQIRLDRGGDVRISMGEKPTVSDLLTRMERANSHGALTPHELVAVTPEGQLVFASPYVEGRGATQKNLPAALARAGVHFLSDLGATSGVAKLDDGRWVVYDDLHPGNVRTMPGGRVEIIDANNRELDQYEVADLTTLGKMPPEKPLAPPKAKPTKKAQKYENAVVVAPMVETHHGTPHEWAPEKRVRHEDGTLEWIPMEAGVPSGAVVVERAPAGRVREDKVGTGETNAAFGWGVLYSAARKALAEHYRKELTSESGEWFLLGMPMTDYRSEIYEDLKQALQNTDPDITIDENVADLRQLAHLRRKSAEAVKAAPVSMTAYGADSIARKTNIDKYLSEAKRYDRLANALEKYGHQLQYRKGGTGNVYTVQLDVDDPELLDWFMPMKDQMFVFDKVAAQFGITREQARKANEHNEMLADIANDLQNRVSDQIAGIRDTELSTPELQNRHAIAEKEWEAHFKQPDVKLGDMLVRMESMDERYTGEKFYERLTEILKHSPKAASKHLDKSGVPGIVFLDRESRKPRRKFEIKQTPFGWEVSEQGHKISTFRTEEFAKRFIAEEQPPTFNNYVIFDPERIKVVAKNGEVVRTVADDLPAPPEPNIVEPVTVAAMAEEDVKDDRDLTVAPMAGTGRRTRKDVSAENYKPAGWTAPFKRLSWEIVKLEQQRRQKAAATTYRTQTMVDDFERKVKKAYRGKPSPEENRNIMTALGNLDNRLTQEQAREAMKMKGAEREGFLHTAHMENVARFKQQQEQALNSLPDEIREAVNVLREELDLEAGETLKDTGLDTELRARLDANQGVFLHSNAFQHFEDDVWGKHIKSDDPEAQRIRRAAEDLFRNEIIGENALAYQKEQKTKGIEVSDEEALRIAAASGDLDQQIATRLDDYLRKETDEPSRLHMLMGRMPVTRTEAGKMLSLDRENIPKEIRDLWGQYDDPATNFAKTLSILANHNAQTRMQNSMLEDGLEKGYFWKQDDARSPGPRPPGLARMSADTRGSMAGVYGPPALKEGLSLMNQRPVRSLLSELNSVPLMMKTVGSIGSAVRNFFGNPLFMVSNGNLPISAVYWPKAFWLSLQRAADFMARPEGRKQLTRMIELGVLDENVDAKILERIAKNARTGHKWEGQAGFGASVAAIQRSFVKVSEKTMIPFQRVYTMADNFWRLANYNVELLRQKWMNPDLALEQQEENAAEITRRTMPTYSNIIEGFRESYGKVSEVAAPYLSFQAEAMRTYTSSVALAFREIASGKPKEVTSGLWRLGGLMAATSAPLALGIASKAMFGYDDDDEKAIRAGLPEYQRNNMLFFLPRGPKGEPRYIDLNFVNPYSLLHTAYTAAWRGTGLEGAFKQFAKPLVSMQPVAGLATDLATNKDSKGGGGQIYDPYASGGAQAASILKRAGRDWVPGTVDSAVKTGEAYLGRDLLGNRLEKTGEKRDLREEIMKVFPGAADVTFDRDKAMQMHVNEYKTAARNASGLFDRKMSADGPVDPGEVGATYKEADERSFRAFQQMRQAYLGLKKLGMSPAEAKKQMLVGFGSEIRKGGLSKTVLQEIVSGNYQRFEPSGQLLKETVRLHRERIPEFKEAQRQQPRSRSASP